MQIASYRPVQACEKIGEYSIEPARKGSVRIKRCFSREDTIVVPDSIDGRTVTEIGAEAFSLLPATKIVCASTIIDVGRNAFRGCANLETLVLPEATDRMDRSWISKCPRLSSIALPGQVKSVRIDSRRASSVRSIHIGPGTKSVSLEHTNDALLERVTVDERNPWISSDGFCLYDASGTTLLRCMTDVRRYTIAPGTKRIAPEAFAYNTMLEEVVIPEGVREVGERAFVGTAIAKLSLPSSLRTIGERSFSSCRHLKNVHLNEGLRRIGPLAFAGCKLLNSVRIPASVESLNLDSFSFERDNASVRITIDPENPWYMLDERGVLYQRGRDGLELLGTLATVEGTYHVKEGTVRIHDKAFVSNMKLERVHLPAGLREIGDSAFMRCANLRDINLPDGLVSVGDKAFYATRVESLHLPATLERIGQSALLFGREIYDTLRLNMRMPNDTLKVRSSKTPSRHSDNPCSITMDDANECFSIMSDFLCERHRDGTFKAIKYVGRGPTVTVPHQVDHIGKYVLASANVARSLVLHDAIEHIDDNGLFVSHPLTMVKVEFADGEAMQVYPLQNQQGLWAQSHAFFDGALDLELLATDCDNNLDRCEPGYARAWRILARLAHPRFLSQSLAEKFYEELRTSLTETVAEFARRNYLEGIGQLFDVGLIDASTICPCIDAANRAHGVAAAGYLINEERTRLSQPVLDFSL